MPAVFARHHRPPLAWFTALLTSRGAATAMVIATVTAVILAAASPHAAAQDASAAADAPATSPRGTATTATNTVQLNDTTFQLADGWTLQLAAGPPLTRYPVHADVAPDGRLLIVESSGSSQPVQQQLTERPHRLVTLEDSDGDGVYDKRVVFADGLMLPQGVLWTADGVLVATPPEIWCYRDADGDGVSDHREIWFDGKTLTGCANDVHGPFLGRDGMIHWAKGAFAQQTYERPAGQSWTTRASHVFRRSLAGPSQSPGSLAGDWIEPVMTGGMDNPVEFVQSLCGERFLTCTFVQYPADGHRDALLHTVYGGVYGKDHGVLQGHPRTGPLMPVMTHLGPAAPAGLTLRQTTLSDQQPLGELLVAQFNLQRVSRHQLVEDGAALTTIDSDLLVANRADFHPTDVLEDRDGTLLVVDTGGWYTLCCPTSHIAQSQAEGAIYRLRPPAADNVAAGDLVADDLVAGLADAAPMRRAAARRRLLADPAGADQLIAALDDPQDRRLNTTVARAEAVWTLIEAIGRAGATDEAAPLLAALLRQVDEPRPTVRLAAIQGLGIYRHQPAVGALIAVLADGGPRPQRYAAEALGRIGDPRAIQPLLQAIAEQARHPVGSPDAQRIAQHALMYALIEIGPATADALAAVLTGDDPDPGAAAQRIAALRVLDQLESPALTAPTVLRLLATGSDAERALASEMLGRQAWGPIVAERLPQLLLQGAADQSPSWPATVQRLTLLPWLADSIATILAQGPDEARQQLLQALVARPPSQLPDRWSGAIAQRLTDPQLSPQELNQWCRVVASANWSAAAPAELTAAFAQTLRRHRDQRPIWLSIAAAAPPGVTLWHTDGADTAERAAAEQAERDKRAAAGERADGAIAFGDLLAVLGDDSPPAQRQQALAALGRQPLTADQQLALARSVADAGPMELTGLLALLRPLHATELNQTLLAAWESNPHSAILPASLVQAHFADHPETVQQQAEQLVQRLIGDQLEQQRAHLQRLITELPAGDAGRGMDVFRSQQAACSACHAIGYVGGNIGPDLTGIHRIRSDYDLLEAIVYPSASFVRSYETVQAMTWDGRIVSGMIADEDAQSITLTTGIDQRVRIERDDIDSLRPGAVSIMPAGLDQQLTAQQLADLLAFLKVQK